MTRPLPLASCYRLGLMGYLYPGEIGGGDPGNVTIFGESGGGAKVATLLAMPDAPALSADTPPDDRL